MTPAGPLDHARRALNVILAVAQIAASFIPALTGYGRPIGEGEPGVSTNPVSPPGPAFAIWGLLFPAVLAYAVYQAAPARAADPLLRRTGWLTALALALTVLWVSLSQLVGIPAAADAGFSAAVVACYLGALARARGGRPPSLVTAPVALMAGWITAALGVNVGAALTGGDASLSPVPVACAIVVLAGAAGVLVPRVLGGGGWYAGPVAWGLGWVAAGNLASGGSPVVAAVAGASALLVVVAAVARPARSTGAAR